METSTDTIIVAVDRLARLEYPSFVKRLIAPELETTGPAQYDVATDLTVLSCCVKAPFKILTASMVANNLIQGNYLAACLGIHDGVAIQAKGIESFRSIKNILKLEKIHLWRSIAADGRQLDSGILIGQPNSYLPMLVERNEEVVIEWKKFGDCQWFKFADIPYFTSLLPKAMA